MVKIKKNENKNKKQYVVYEALLPSCHTDQAFVARDVMTLVHEQAEQTKTAGLAQVAYMKALPPDPAIPIPKLQMAVLP